MHMVQQPPNICTGGLILAHIWVKYGVMVGSVDGSPPRRPDGCVDLDYLSAVNV